MNDIHVLQSPNACQMCSKPKGVFDLVCCMNYQPDDENDEIKYCCPTCAMKLCDKSTWDIHVQFDPTGDVIGKYYERMGKK